MRAIKSRFATPLFALLFTASLVFGVTSSFAQVKRVAPAAAACANNNDNLLGNCSPTCDARCREHFYTSGACISDQNGNCCVCLQ